MKVCLHVTRPFLSLHLLPLLLLLLFVSSVFAEKTDQALVTAHVAEHASDTFREPSGVLKYPYLVPAGPYDQLWDWDSMFTGVALLNYGSQKYFVGSMLNFLEATNTSNGDIQGCLLPSGGTGTIHHAKPIIIQGSWLACKTDLSTNLPFFEKYHQQMRAQLDYWVRERRDNATGLYVWFDQLESGQDNLVLSTCPSSRSKCWDPDLHANAIASADIMSFLYREFTAYELFNKKWSEAEKKNTNGDASSQQAFFLEEAYWARDMAQDIKRALDEHLWREDLDIYIAANLTKAAKGFKPVLNRVSVTGFPLWANLASKAQAMIVAKTLQKSDLLSKFGWRSTGSDDPRYNNVNMIKPYSNWQGPIWVNENVILSYGLMHSGWRELALNVSQRVIHVLAQDLRKNNNTWHEGYSSETGEGLAAPGFLSWDTLAADWSSYLQRNVDPFEL